MSLPITPPVTPVQQTTAQDLPLRLHERVTAQVMEVTATQAILQINGYPVVAKLTSKDQASELLSSKYATFIIANISQNEVTLKFANKTAKTDDQYIIGEKKDYAGDISKSIGLTGTEHEAKLIRLALLEKLPISKEIVSQLLEAVYGSGIDINEAIQLAVKLKAAGLPVTSSSLQMASQFTELHLADILTGLIKDLSSVLAQMDIHHPLTGQIQNALQQLQVMIPDLSASGDKINACLQELMRFVGKPYEKLLSEQVNGGSEMDKGSFSLLNLLQLEKDLRQSGQSRAADGIERFLEQVRQDQFMNIKAEAAPGKGSWGEVNFIVHLQTPDSQEASDAKVRISYRQDKKPKVIDPQFTNLILQVDLEPSKEVEFNLSLFQRKVNVDISSPNPEITGLFRDSLPELSDLMDRLGYSIVKTNVHTSAEKEKRKAASPLVSEHHVIGVDIEV